MGKIRRPGRQVVRDAPLPVRPAFRRGFLDFERGIRMGNLEPHERITQIVKHHLVSRHGRDFLIDKWGRGAYWQWICWVVRENRDAKPLSSGYNFGCAKFYVSLDREARQLEAGVQMERAPVGGRAASPADVRAAEDWDFFRFVAGLRRGTPLAGELDRLVGREGFRAHVGGTARAERTLRGRRWGGVAALRRACRAIPDDAWGWVQVFWPTPERELDAMDGGEIVATVLAVFDELAPLMNRVMQGPYLRTAGRT